MLSFLPQTQGDSTGGRSTLVWPPCKSTPQPLMNTPYYTVRIVFFTQNELCQSFMGAPWQHALPCILGGWLCGAEGISAWAPLWPHAVHSPSVTVSSTLSAINSVWQEINRACCGFVLDADFVGTDDHSSGICLSNTGPIRSYLA